ncbi:MAG TPA: TIGR00282 family metallophosphoesterase [Candidatus Omnitrophota bacterium]|nr:TIGR00282 family metallophosphoesterase [Candidatus Omnitrophota bacterium]HPT07159.1 TIGR00282 family metallophosphoesterase [Candidatus Omnitrophota bacterium]
MKILFIGDIVGNPGREAVKKLVPVLIREERLDFVIANAENAAGGSGITPAIAYELFDAGVGAITSGDHIWKKREIFEIIDRDPRVIRPVNFPERTPGKGWGVFATSSGAKIGVVNVQGRVFMDPMECPFRTSRAAIDTIRKETNVVIVDIHAEATSEKVALGWYLDGIASAVLGTHTHIQTADEKILPQGTAFLTDAGMTGPCYSVIGRKIEDVLERFITLVPRRFEVADKDVQLQGAIVDIDESNGSARSITRVQKKLGV